MSSPRDPTRLRHGLNPLSTSSLVGYNNQLSSPMSAVSMASSHMQPIQTPGSAIQPYNPQEWVSSPAQIPERQHQFATTEAQVNMPLHGSPQQAANQGQTSASGAGPPPPPYSPPRRTHQPRPVSTAFEYGHVQVSTPPPSRFSTLIPHRPSPEPQASRAFPPPPGMSGRGSSRDRLFGIPLGRRKDREQLTSSPEPMHPPMPASRRSVGPLAFHQPEPERVVSMSLAVNTQIIPPASRRAASTGAIETPNSARSRSTSQTRWEPGMPVPPPPPGPPPSGSRSQSVQGMDRATVPIISPPTRRRPPSGVTSLGPVPPTPAGWVEGDAQVARPTEAAPPPVPLLQPAQPSPSVRGRSPGLTIDTALASDPNQPVEQPLGSNSSASGLNRARAVRHDKTIIQRRTESRNQYDPVESIDAVVQPRPISNIVVPTSANGMVQKITLPKTTPRSAGRIQLEPPRTGDSSGHYDSRNSTPRAPDSAKLAIREVETPPFSPAAKPYRQTSGSHAVPPKSLPTPPLRAGSASSSLPAEATHPPGSAALPLSKDAVVNQNADEFANGSIERFRAFAIRESAVATDADRVRLFADFIVNESRIRRERYATAIGAMGSEIFDLTRDLFRPMVPVRRESGISQEDWTPGSSEPNRSHRGSVGSISRGDGQSSSAPTSANLPPSPGQAPAANWGDPSRGGFERSKRESKYMGVPKEQWLETEQSAVYGSTGEQSSSSEYPPEKTGWHDEGEQTPHMPPYTPAGSAPSPAVNMHGLLDVSRLVTLPPPYPRHHPAVNNSHPELSSIRIAVRALSELSDIDSTKERFAASSSKRREESLKAASDRRQAMRVNLQKEINSGNLSYADAGIIEADFNDQEKDKKKELEKAEYEHFQNQVVLPLNDILTERINRATELFDDLTRHMFDNGEIDADMPQEEGDDRPELLEKLTLLKWIFEQRESLHRVIYDLLSDRNGRYRDVVLTPYRLSGNAEKLKSAEDFFGEDAAKRENAFANEVLNRAREFRSVMEEAVARGVELQLSAFWDIAPPLCRLLESIPLDLEDFGIQIPSAEYEENPSYHEHPFQYLYSLLLHAEKSSYQFIEAHTNQLCLLHEVKEAVMNAKARVLATQVIEADGTATRAVDREQKAQHMKDMESQRLTEDLKEKVRMVQEQWNSALGEAMTSVKERTGEWLLQTGGWDETLEDGGVGVA
ncbi:hypothetical protein PT974_11955 [Cladobotryum mycophilum]|uniref:Uncharacterized protein n=1 Tax=Cladobotryum mycophilum TaxID=491253 RepID=A0ABR0S6P3_9HYPO